MDSLTETPAWITELLAATGRFETLAEETKRNADALVQDLKQIGENNKKLLA